MKIKTKFNAGDTVYIVKGVIVKECIYSVETTSFGDEPKDTYISYKFKDGFSGDYSKTEDEVFSTKEEAIKYLNAHVYDNTCQKTLYID